MCTDSIVRQRYLYADMPTSYKTAMNNSVYDTHGIRPISDPAVKYNCHSYAWYQQSTSNSYWIDYADSFVASRTKKAINDVVSGNKIVYFSSSNGTHQGITHSGVVIGITESNYNRYFTIRSKWGMSGLYEHSLTNCPYFYYDSGNATYPLDYAFYS